MTSITLSFDDSLIAQYKWARWLGEVGVCATFYISPGVLGECRRLSEELVARIASLGHVIGNHTWGHECPRRHGVDATVESIARARVWLEDRGYSGTVFAMPYGSRGGGWDEAVVKELQLQGYEIRDVRMKGEGPEQFAWPAAVELTDESVQMFDGVNLVYAHGDLTLNDARFVEFVNDALEQGLLRR